MDSKSFKSRIQQLPWLLPDLALRHGYGFYKRRLRFGGAYRFTNRKKNSDRLLVILAGYKEYLWRYTLSRVATYAPQDLDVCVVSSGALAPRLADLAKSFGWSVLWTKKNRVGLGVNLAIREHPNANWLYKLDEDIFICDGYFDSLQDGYRRIRAEGRYHPGFCSPLINVNGYSYTKLLEILDLLGAYRARFGESRSAADGVKIHYDPEAAQWVWTHSLPLDQVAKRLASRPFEYSLSPHRFSIGAILLEREFWASIGGFRVTRVPGRLGYDELELCIQCLTQSRVMAVIHNVFAGHFAFYPQELGMREMLAACEPSFGLETRAGQVGIESASIGARVG